MHHLFLSHSSKDKARARDIYRELKSSNVKVWFDEAELHAGDSLLDKVESALAEIDTFVVLLSKNSISSNWVSSEIKMVLSRDIVSSDVTVIPVLLEKVEVPLSLADRVCVDMTSAEKFRPGIARIKQTIGMEKAARGLSAPSEAELIELAIRPIHGNDCYLPRDGDIKNRAVSVCKIPHDEKIYKIITYASGGFLRRLFGGGFQKGEICICVTERAIYAHSDGHRLVCEHRNIKDLEVKLFSYEVMEDAEYHLSRSEKGLDFCRPGLRFQTDSFTSHTFLEAVETIRSFYE